MQTTKLGSDMSTLLQQFDSAIAFYLRHLYVDATLPEVHTACRLGVPSEFSTTFRFKRFFVAEETTRGVLWSIDDWKAGSEDMAVMRKIFQFALPWLDTRLTRCDTLKDIDIFNDTIIHSHLAFPDEKPSDRGNPRLSLAGAVLSKTRELQWHEKILKLGRANAERVAAEATVPETMDLQ